MAYERLSRLLASLRPDLGDTIRIHEQFAAIVQHVVEHLRSTDPEFREDQFRATIFFNTLD